MRVSKKRTCNNCYALEKEDKYSANFGAGHYTGIRVFCALGYETEQTSDFETIPLEPCPKPLKIAELLEAHKRYSEEKTNERD